MNVQTLVVGPLGVNCYVLGDTSTRQAIIIDPGGNPSDILNAVQSNRMTVVAIVNTHAHFDHILALNEIRQATGAPLLLHRDENPVLQAAQAGAAMFGMRMSQPDPPERLLQDGEQVVFGDTALTVLFTPGHTPGGICLLQDKNLFVGDTLFQGSIGRTDLPGGDYGTLMSSIRDKLLPLPDDTIVYPGHGPTTTIGEEKQLNPFVRPLITGKWMV